MSLYALNLFDLADNDDYLAYSKRSVAAVGKYGGTVVALGRLDAAASPEPGSTPPAPGDGAGRVAGSRGFRGVSARSRAS